MKKIVLIVVIVIFVVAAALAEGETYTINSQTVVYKTLEGFRNFAEIVIKKRGHSGDINEAGVKALFLDIGEDRAFYVAKGTECILLEDQTFMDDVKISTIFIKGKGLGYIIKSEISPKVK